MSSLSGFQKLPFRAITLTAVLFMTPYPALSQGLTGGITGTVTDPSGAAVANASVTAKNVGTNAEVKAQTNASGTYRIVGLVPGDYTITVEDPGFRKATMPPQEIDVSSTRTIDVALEIGQPSEVVTVNEAAALLNADDAQLGKTLRNIPNLPILSGNGGRNPLQLVGLQPGVTMATSSTNSLGPFSLNGGRTQSNNYILDGGDSNDLAINIPDSVQQLSPDAIAEFRVVTGAMKAEYGRNGGGTIEIVTKSGANEFHGVLSETLRNKVLNSVPFFQNSTPGPVDTFANGLPRKPDYKSNDFDAALGGRIIRDRTFFFISYLGFRRVQGVARSATVPTDQERALVNQFGVPAAKNILALVPSASSGNTLFVSPSNSLSRDQGSAKIDQVISSKNTLSGSYFAETQEAFDPFAFSGSNIPGFGTQGVTRFKNANLRDTHIFSPSVLNEARFGFHRRAQPSVVPINHQTPASLGFTGIVPDDPANAGPPNIQITGFTQIGNTIQGPQARFDNTWQYSDNLSWVKGNHSLKFGVEYLAYEQNQLFDFINNGVFTIDGLGTESNLVPRTPGVTNDALNDFIHGFATALDQANANHQGYRDKFFFAYAQDDWKVRRNLTLNFGLRWEYGAPLTELNDQVAAFRLGQQSSVFTDAPVGLVYPGDKGITRSTYQRDLNNFGPRVGLAWSPSEKMTLRMGYGLFYDVPVSELTLQFLGQAPFGITPEVTTITDFTHPYSSSQDNPIPQPFPFTPVKRGGRFDFTNIAPIGLTVMNPDFATPYVQQWNFNLQYQLGRSWLAEMGYVGSKGTKLLNRREQNYALVLPGSTTGNTNQRRRYNQGNPQNADFGGAVFGGITNQITDANSIYNALQLSVTKRFTSGFSMTNAYTWGHSIDEGSGLRTGAAAGNGNIYNRQLDRGDSEYDVRHRFVSSWVYELPFLRSQQGIVGHILGGWGVSGVFSIQSGFPVNIYDSADRCLCGMPTGSQHPDSSGVPIQFYDPRSVAAVDGRPNSYFDGTGGGSATAATNPYFRRVGTGNTLAAGAGRFGTFGRNVFHGPGFANWDISASKKIFIRGERQYLEFRGEFFNAFNHTQFDHFNSSNFGNIGSANFGVISATRDPRIIQFTARYTF
ncbi:MAG TPA: TonB-dependent receptor [Bryobacteraceae bacterium]